MIARFLIDQSFLLAPRQRFVVEGRVIDGSAQPGMHLRIAMNDRFSMDCLIEAIEPASHGEPGALALLVAYADDEEGRLLGALNLDGQEVLLFAPSA